MFNFEDIKLFLSTAFSIFAVLVFISCGSVKLADGEYELKQNVIEINTKKINKSDVDLYIKQQPATKKLFKKKQPTVFDAELVEQSHANIKELIRQLGYYSCDVKDTIIYKNRDVKVIYKITVDEPLRIGQFTYNIADSCLRQFVYADSLQTKISLGAILSTELLETERDRITANLRNNGYFDFNKTYITFRADSTDGRNNVKLKMNIENVSHTDSLGARNYQNHKQYKIANVYIHTRYDAARALTSSQRYAEGFDTLNVDGMNLIYRRSLNIDKNLFRRINLINSGDMYSEQNANQTYNNFANLNLFKNLRVEFEKTQDIIDSTDCVNGYIYLTPLTVQGYNVGLEVSTSSSGLWGISPSLGYIHRNFLKGAERFELNFAGTYQFKIGNQKGYKKSTEFGVSTSLDLPKFLMPIQINYFKKSIPHTKFTANYMYQKRNLYTRTLAGASFGYDWKASDFARYTFNPVELKVVKMKDINPDFYKRIEKDPYVRNLYENHFSLGLSASFTHTNQFETYRRSTHYFRLNFDIAGNAMSLFNSLMKKDSIGNHLIFDTRYSQYVRADATFVQNKIISKKTNFVYRFFAGIGRAYGNSISLPFEKMYYAGGANSLRGWQIRSVGPGSAVLDTTFTTPNQVADFKLEFNAELRFKIAWVLEGAWFVDAGNIWTLNKKDTREGARLKANTFFKTIAIDTGLGARLNFGIFTFRLDWGFKVHDPALPSSRFVKMKNWLKSDNNSLHFGIGYPF